jgi:cell division protein FtsQ
MNATAPHAFPRWEDALRAGTSHFQRGEIRGRVQRAQRRILLRPKHIALAVLAISALLFGLSRAYLFLIGWDVFTIKTVILDCRVESARTELEAALADCRLGNILLLDIARLKDALERHRWVREAVIRKDFPATLRVEIRERRPAAVLGSADGLRLIDRDGVILENLASPEGLDLPLLRDEDGFRTDAAEKLELAWSCIDSLGPDERSRIESLDLSEFGKVVLTLKGNPTRLILGGDRFPEKLALYLEAEVWLKKQLGELDYVDLRLFQDRLTVRQVPLPQESPPAALLPTSSKEAD